MKTPLARRNLRLRLALFTAAIASLSIVPGSRAVTTWNNTGTDFNTAANWSNGLPSTSNPAVFASTEASQPNVSSSISVSQLQFNAGGYDLTGTNSSVLTLTSTSGTAANGGVYLNIATSGIVNTLDSSLTINLGATGTAATSNILFSNNATGAVASTLNINSTLAGPAGLTFGASVGTFNVTGTNTYGGGTTIYGGASLLVNVTNAQAFSSGAITFHTGSLDNTSSGTLTMANPFSVNGTLAYVGSAQSLVLSGAGALVANSNISVGGQTLTINNAISGAFTLNKQGAGTLVLGGNNTFSGALSASAGTLTLNGTNATSGVTINGTTLNIGNAGALGSGTLTVSGSATVDNTSGAALTTSNAVAINNTLTYSTAAGTSANNLTFGTASINNSRSVVLNGGGTLTFSGGLVNTTASGFGLVVSNGAGTTAATALNLGGFTLATASTASVGSFLGGSSTQTGNGNINVTGAIVDGGTFANNLSVKTTGTVTFSGTNTYGGTTTLGAAGTLLINGTNSGTGAITANTGIFGGSGTVAGMLAVGSAGTLSPGSANTSGTIGTFKANGGLSLAGVYLIDLGATAGSTDLTTVTGALTLTSTTSTLTVRSLAAGATTGTVYEILTDSNAAVTGTFKGLADGTMYTDAAGDTYTVNYNTNTSFAGDVSLTLDSIAAVPEPSTWVAGLTIFGLLGWRHRRSARGAAKSAA